jgi:hypothetical protein
MTARINYLEMFEQLPHLTLEESAGGFFSAIDQHGRLFTPPSLDMDVPIRLMRAMALKGHATLDEGSITWFRALRQFGDPHSVKVEGEPEALGVSRAVLGEPASPSTSVAGKDGVGTDGVPPSDRGGCAAAPAPISPPHLHLVRGDAA